MRGRSHLDAGSSLGSPLMESTALVITSRRPEPCLQFRELQETDSCLPPNVRSSRVSQGNDVTPPCTRAFTCLGLTEMFSSKPKGTFWPMQYFVWLFWTSLVAQRLQHLCVMWETQVRSLGLEDSLEKEMAIPLQYSCLENPMDGGPWRATVHGITKSQTRLSDFTFFSFVFKYQCFMVFFPALLRWDGYSLSGYRMFT